MTANSGDDDFVDDVAMELPSGMDGSPPFQLDNLKSSDDNHDEPSEFGDDDALLSVAEGSEPFSNSGRTQEKDGSQTGTQGKSSQGKGSSGNGTPDSQ